MNLIKSQLLLFLFLLVNLQTLSAQFTITNPLTTNDATGLVIGDNGYLTAARGVDPNGQGYLRLTDAVASQKGYYYVDTSFSSGSGVIADFEYKAWRNVADNTYFGADGFSVFLFDATVPTFSLGGYGGSLGYATYSNPANKTGLSGGYVGIGFDEYGNFSRAAENRNGGFSTTNYLPNSIVLRGPTSATYNLSNPYLTSVALGDRTQSVDQIRKTDGIDYNTTTSTRPTKETFYRRVQIFVTKSGANYLITVKWRKDTETTFTTILTYTLNGTTYPLPANLKIGFAASTGGGYNIHEIRNILITTPGNLRVDSRANSSVVCKENKTKLTFDIEVSNDSTGDLSSIDFKDKISDQNGILLSQNQFKINSITTTGFTSSTIAATNNTNSISGVVSLPAKSSGIITVTGDYYPNALKTNAKFLSTATVTSVAQDDDLTNNTAISEITVRKCGIISNPSLPSKTR